MVKKKGDHFKRSEVKSSIVEFILENSGPVGEPVIREYLKKKYEVIDQGTINKHLHNLQDIACIELIPPDKKGLRNHWDIKTPKHLNNIKFHFKEIELNTYEKSLNIILKKCNYKITTFTGIKFYVRLFLSASFFNMCIETSIETLCDRAKVIFRYDKGFKKYQPIKKLLGECYAMYIGSNPNCEISEETFVKTMEEMVQKKDEMSEEIALKMWDEKFHGFSKEMSRETFLKMMEKDRKMYMKMDETMTLMEQQKLIFPTLYFDLLFEHCFQRDVFNDVASLDELEFAKKTKENSEESNALFESKEYGGSVKILILGDLKQISKIIAKYKHPSIFSIYNNPEDIFQNLIEVNGFQTVLKL